MRIIKRKTNSLKKQRTFTIKPKMKIFSYVLNVMSRIDIKNVSLFFPNVATGTTNPYNTNEKNAHAKYMYNKRRRSVIFTCCNIYPEGKRNW